MTAPSQRTARPLSVNARRLAAGTLACVAGFGSVGCEVDGWLGDPSVVGRWEHTPTTVPVLETIDAIEADTGEFIDVTPVMPEDLIPEPQDYTLAPGDFIRVTILDLVAPGVPSGFDLAIEPRGTIEIPQLGRFVVDGLTIPEVRDRIAQRLIERDIIKSNPVIDVQALGRRQATFSIFGAVQQAARFNIPYPDYRLLEALTDAGGVSPVIKEVYVIRQVPLTEAVEGRSATPERPAERQRPNLPGIPIDIDEPAGTDQPEDVLDVLDSLNDDPKVPSERPTSPPEPGRIGLPDYGSAASPARFQSDGDPPPIDLPDDAGTIVQPPGGPATTVDTAEQVRAIAERGEWAFINGRWVRVMVAEQPPAPEGLPEGEDPLESADSDPDLVTQRVIEVPTGPLLQGVARFNIVIRPGDIIHVPVPQTGLAYATGPGIARDGAYSIPANGRLTFLHLVASAGGYSAIGIPERIDLIRMVGDDRQATIRVNGRAIAEGSQPNFYLKPDDIVNFGTNFLATPYAVIRNAFRFSYGFGFQLDRNFGNDVFGAPPVNRRF